MPQLDAYSHQASRERLTADAEGTSRDSSPALVSSFEDSVGVKSGRLAFSRLNSSVPSISSSSAEFTICAAFVWAFPDIMSCRVRCEIKTQRRNGLEICLTASARSLDRTLMFLILTRFFHGDSLRDKSLGSLPPKPVRKLHRLNLQAKASRVPIEPSQNRHALGQHVLDGSRQGVSSSIREQRDQHSGKPIARQTSTASRPPVINHTATRKRTALQAGRTEGSSHRWCMPRQAESTVP